MAKKLLDDDKEVLDEDEDDECFDYDYYNNDNDNDLIDCDPKHKDNEYFDYECLVVEQVEKILNESVEIVCSTFNHNPSQAKVSDRRSPVQVRLTDPFEPVFRCFCSPTSGTSIR